MRIGRGFRQSPAEIGRAPAEIGRAPAEIGRAPAEISRARSEIIRATYAAVRPWTPLLLAPLLLRPDSARAVPAFAEQTGQPCAACHVGAFGPQLKQYGRDFKLNGYVASDGKSHGPPVAVSNQLSFTHTNN